MTIITIDETSLLELFKPILRISLSLLAGIVTWLLLKMLVDTHNINIKRKKLEDAKKIYTRRKREFEEDKKAWKEWRNTNYEITDLVEGGTYY